MERAVPTASALVLERMDLRRDWISTGDREASVRLTKVINLRHVDLLYGK